MHEINWEREHACDLVVRAYPNSGEGGSIIDGGDGGEADHPGCRGLQYDKKQYICRSERSQRPAPRLRGEFVLVMLEERDGEQQDSRGDDAKENRDQRGSDIGVCHHAVSGDCESAVDV